jgi:serine/threonine protein kinase
MNLAPTTVLQKGKYTINGTLGIGGFGITYRAIHTHLKQTVVLKTLNESLRQHPESSQFQQQFIAEAQRLSRCQHSNIVRVIDFFEEAGQSFVAMDYIPGKTLSQIVEAGEPLPEAQALHYIRQIASAVNAVHKSGLLHQDIKPENIIRRADSHIVMLIDFGIARDFTAGSQQTHTNLLSPGYAPIEQYLYDGNCTPATDVYGIAATLYYLLSGVPPIAAPLRSRIPLQDLRQFQPNLSPSVELAILRGLEIDPNKRPQTVENWLSMLQETEQVAERKGEESLRLPAPPPPQLTLLAFMVTAVIAGWMGFDLAWRYNHTNAKNGLGETQSFPSLEDLLKSRDLSGPMFGQPSVESSPLAPIDLQKPPKPTFDSNNTIPSIESSEPSLEPSPSPSSETPTPEPEPQPAESPTLEPESLSSELSTPEPKTPIPPVPQAAPVPEVPPLPPEPPRYSPRYSPPPATPSPTVVESLPPLEPQPSPGTLGEGAEPPIPSEGDYNSDNAIVPTPPPVPEQTVPFPEPATN